MLKVENCPNPDLIAKTKQASSCYVAAKHVKQVPPDLYLQGQRCIRFSALPKTIVIGLKIQTRVFLSCIRMMIGATQTQLCGDGNMV